MAKCVGEQHFVYVFIKMHPITDQDMGNKPMLVQNIHEHHLVPLKEGSLSSYLVQCLSLWPLDSSKLPNLLFHNVQERNRFPLSVLRVSGGFTLLAVILLILLVTNNVLESHNFNLFATVYRL